MRHILIFIATILVTSFVFGQTLNRQDNETAEMFANRSKPDSTELAYTVIETTSLDTTARIIIAFFTKTIYEIRQMDTYVDHSQYKILVGYSFIPKGNNNYERRLIDTIPPDGGDPEIIAIFFANADKDKEKELVVLCKYEQQHYDYGGAFYETYIYDLKKANTQYLQQLSEKFRGCECGWRNGKVEKAKYKTAKDVRAGLSKMGFRQ